MARDPHINETNKRESRYEKMFNPFYEAGVLEVYFNEKWVRVISKHFRSYSGPRRITRPEKVVHGLPQLEVPFITEEFNGPVYAMDTNYEYIGEVLNDFVSRELLN